MGRPRGMRDGVQLPRVVVPEHIHEMLKDEARFTGMSIADVIRDALADRYRDRLFDADLAKRDEAVRRARAHVTIAEVSK